MAKARPGVALMSIEAQVEELYGDSRDDQWKQEEIASESRTGYYRGRRTEVNMAAGLLMSILGVKAMQVKVMNRVYR